MTAMNIPRRTALLVVGWSAAGVLAVGTVAGVGIASAGGTQVNGIAPASTASPTATGSAAPDKGGPRDRGRFPRGRFGDLGRGLGGGALHGEFVAKDKDGKIVTRVVQSGSVTAVSTTSITLKSEDGFTATYAVNGDTKVRVGGDNAAISGVKTGNTAWVIGTKSGDTSTATVLAVKT
jgi:hypothetical protein